MKLVDGNGAWRTHGIDFAMCQGGCVRCPTPDSNQIQWYEEKNLFSRIGKRRKKEKRKEERKGFGLHFKRYVLFLLGISLSKGHSIAMELSPNIGAGSKQFGTNCGVFFGQFWMPETIILV